MQAGTYFPKVRRMLLCHAPLTWHTRLASFHAASRAPCSCHSVSSWDRSSNFGGSGLCWWSSPGQIYPSDGFWSRMSAWRTTPCVNWAHRIGFRMSELFRKIDEDFGGSISKNTQPNCRVTFLLTPFTNLFFNLAMRMGTLFPQSASIHRLVEQTLQRMPFFTSWIGASSFEVILARPSKHFSTWTFSSVLSGSRRISRILLHERTRKRIRLCHFYTLIDIVAETAIVSFHTLPVGFSLPTIS